MGLEEITLFASLVSKTQMAPWLGEVFDFFFFNLLPGNEKK